LTPLWVFLFNKNLILINSGPYPLAPSTFRRGENKKRAKPLRKIKIPFPSMREGGRG
jgi:hypothetical protein